MGNLIDKLRFDGQVVLVTGAGRGIGRACALLLAERGARVVVSDVGTDLFGTGHDPTPAQEVVGDIHRGGGAAVAYLGDLATEEGARGAVRAALHSFDRIDAIVHNAGFTLGGRSFANETLDRLDTLLAINTRAAFALAQEAWPVWQTNGGGRLVLSSSAAMLGMARSIPYSMAKASYIGMVRGLAAEGAAHRIVVNAIEPTGATRMAENMMASEFRTWFLETMDPALVAPLVAVLTHERCPVSGELLAVGGGRVARTIIAETQGWVDRALTPESTLAHLDDALAMEGFRVLADGPAASAYHAEVLGFRPTEPLRVVARDTTDDRR